MGDVTPVTAPAPLSECTCSPGGPDDIRHDQGCPCRVDSSPEGEHADTAAMTNQDEPKRVPITMDEFREFRALRAEVERLREAGIRLAALLDETLGSAPGTVSAEDVDAALTRWDSLVDATDA